MKKKISKFYKINNQYLKIVFTYNTKYQVWFQNIVVAKTKRKCNDCIFKSEKSPKKLYGRCTGNKLGIQPFKIALKELLEFEKTVHNTQINIVGASQRLNDVYKYLSRYGYKEYSYLKDGKTHTLMYKEIN